MTDIDVGVAAFICSTITLLLGFEIGQWHQERKYQLAERTRALAMSHARTMDFKYRLRLIYSDTNNLNTERNDPLRRSNTASNQNESRMKNI